MPRVPRWAQFASRLAGSVDSWERRGRAQDGGFSWDNLDISPFSQDVYRSINLVKGSRWVNCKVCV